MGLRGPKADPTKPNSRTKSRGNRKTSSTAYGHQQIRKVVAEQPVPPSWLNKDQLKIWDEIVPPLFELGLTHAVDAHMLGAYCVEFSEYLEAKKALSTVKTTAEKNELKKLAKESFEAAKKISDSFGMSHKARVAQGIKMTGSGPASASEGGASVGNEAKKAAWHKKAASR